MNTLQAFKDTLILAEKNGMPPEEGIDGCQLYHLYDMLDRITPTFSEGKLNRWLGWAQGVIVAQGYGTLEEMKQINRLNA